ncbi:hypothetical protein F4820DRAFT_83346 [Hypoxylon rubiginosum]|uniref:Uncharacterized protein n=1 Tax=Hypoxylon rubiginosum TaxID=110542 RepID=A0ACB9YP84_9PEZI|nr:hypothetical protein F4820DRAFT_83346 [Hypoxylon rubiginosum]
MPRPVAIPRPRSVCQICDSLVGRRLPSTKYPLGVRNVTGAQAQVGKTLSKIGVVQKRMLASAAIPTGKTVSSASNTRETTEEHDNTTKRGPTTASQELSSVTNMMTYLERSKSKVLSNRRIPPEADVSAALKACRVVADYIMDDAVQPQISHMVNELDSAASELLSLDSSASPQSSKSSDTTFAAITAQVKQIIDKISDTAYSVLSHPPVFITPDLLKLYVDIQARLGRPETLPRVFQMYASKPMPREAAGSISYVNQNPAKMANAIDSKVIERALDTAIEARNLDAAVGIIENSYAAKAFIRSKLVRQGVLPAGTFAATPIAAYILATNFSSLQSTMDGAAATNVAFVGILAYVGFTASIGLVALTTANDQMRRVTWAPGVPLRTRWMKEEERAALDKIACAWGFQEKWRQGEEEGGDWDALREYIGQKGMVLDRTELMEGMDH